MIKNPISYPGNKNRLVGQLLDIIPTGTEFFVDVFCGSAVVAANSNSKKLILNDINPYTLEVLKYQHDSSFSQIISDLEDIIQKYGLTYSMVKPKGFYKEYKHEGLSIYNRDGYLKLKDDYNKTKDIRLLFALLIYGFNHYLRFNKKGEFNVPVGKVDLSKSIYEELKRFQDSFNGRTIELSNLDFRDQELYRYEDAIYYFDPPYLITNAPYNLGWSEKDEKDLLGLLDRLNEKGLRFALSNVILSNGKENLILKEWAQKYKIHYLKRQYRNANYQKINITDTIEVLVCNF